MGHFVSFGIKRSVEGAPLSAPVVFRHRHGFWESMAGPISGARNLDEIQTGRASTGGLVHAHANGDFCPVRIGSDSAACTTEIGVRSLGIHNEYVPFYKILYFCC